MSNDIKIEKTGLPKAKPDENNLGFGKYTTDHMFIMDLDSEHGWHDPRIVPYSPLSLDPATSVLHYAQAVFEGLKAYRTRNGGILLFRPEENMKRLNISNDRMCIPPIDVDFAVEAIKTLVDLERDWVPSTQGTSLYIRPFVIATEPFLGVHPSSSYKFIIILSPVGAYYPQGINPVKIFVETKYVRAAKGGAGYSKGAANYALSLKAQVEAKKKGYTQVLWLDSVERKYIDEVGTSNVFFKINGKVVTPMLYESILAGITRDSSIKLIEKWGIPLEDRRISINEVYEAHENGCLEEAFATGTAAVISPIGELSWNDNRITINGFRIGELSRKLYDTLTGIQYGTLTDDMGWIVKV